MALWSKNMALSEHEKQMRIRKREEAIVVRNGWGNPAHDFSNTDAYRSNEDIESASNRRAAGCYLPNL